MIINATQIRVGMILNVEGELFRVTWTMHRTPGKGNAVMQTKLKSLATGKNSEQRYMSNERVEKADLETKEMQYLYDDGEGFVFMDKQSFEQVSLSKDLLGEGHVFLKDGKDYFVTFFQEEAVGIELPKTVDLKVTSAPPDIKKATATSTLKPVELENGITIQAPGFVKEGDVLRINTETFEYLERA